MTTTKRTARDEILAAAEENGWELHLPLLGTIMAGQERPTEAQIYAAQAVLTGLTPGCDPDTDAEMRRVLSAALDQVHDDTCDDLTTDGTACECGAWTKEQR